MLRYSLSTGLALLALTGCQPAPTTVSAPSAPVAAAPAADTALTTVALGTEATLAVLFSYPNGTTPPVSEQTLAQTIEHYLQQTLARDQLGAATVSVSVDASGVYQAQFSGTEPALAGYSQQLPQFLKNGQLAADAVTALQAAGKWDAQAWRMFLPLGLAMVNQRSVQLLHFPPDYSLPEQDYLGSKTSQRWEQLLQLNNVAAADISLYESILDVAPIAAPASAGSSLAETYSAFQPYVLSQFALLLNVDRGTAAPLPVVAYGGPVRSWVSTYYGVTDFGVNTAATIKVTDTLTAPILGANHPSYIWYAKDQGRAAAMTVMQQDLISACWQAAMGANPQQVSTDVLQQCTGYWQGQPMTVCINMEIQAFDQTEAEAEASCASSVPTVLESLPPPAML